MGKTGAGLLADFEIRLGESTALKIGPPFQIRASMRRYSQDVSITFSLEGQAGERYRSLVKKNGAEAPGTGRHDNRRNDSGRHGGLPLPATTRIP